MKHKIIDGEPRTKYTLHTFTMPNCDDPELYGVAAEPIHHWQQTTAGKFRMEKARDIEFHTVQNPATMEYKVAITGYLTAKQATYFDLM